jgi:hypothetical protein
MDRLRLWDDAESEGDAGAEEEEQGEREYDLDKHYDTSLGSLRDFIVDESDDSEGGQSVAGLVEEEDEEDEAVMSDDCTSSGSSAEVVRRPIIVVDSDDDDDDQGILHHTPPRRPVALPDFSRLTIDEYPVDSDSDSSSSARPVSRPTKSLKTPKTRKVEKDCKIERERIASLIFRDLNKRVFDGKLGDCTIEWNKRLLTTAGQAKSSK